MNDIFILICCRLDYCGLLMGLKRCTQTRRVFDRALQALPVTQHKEIWKLYMEWAKGLDIPETAIRVFRRYLMYDPAYREEYIDYLEEIEQYEEAARQLSICLNDEDFVSPTGKTHHQMWMRLCDICSKHPEAVVNTIKVEAIIRSGISKFSDEVGRLWNSLADYYILLGQFDKARDIYEEAINSVSTVRDFTIIFDAYIKVEESLLTAKMRYLQEDEEEDGDQEIQKTDEEKEELMTEINMRLARIEYLMEKRPLLLNSVLLRQNPHNVHEWHKRAKLYKQDETRQILTYSEAVKTIDPKQALGKLGTIWMAWAQMYEKKGDIGQAETLYENAVQVNYKTVEELAAVWCEWAEMEIRCGQYLEALRVMQRAVEEPVLNIKRRKAMAAAKGKGETEENFEGSVTADRLFKNVKVWSFYLDLEESLGSVDSCKAAYDRAMDLKIITAQMALNYAAFLEENFYYEDSFKVYEKSVAMFEFPQVKKIWLTYLDKFVARYEGTKLERLRDLYEQAIAKVEKDEAAEFYIKYARIEEQFGLARHVVNIYNRATKAVPEKLKFNLYRLYVKKVEQHFGIIKCRPVYEQALKELSDEDCKNICKEYFEMERKLGEIDRARAILRYGSQFADTRRDPGYWQMWREFEEAHGNEETFRDMLRVQRSVEVAFSQVIIVLVVIPFIKLFYLHPLVSFFFLRFRSIT